MGCINSRTKCKVWLYYYIILLYIIWFCTHYTSWCCMCTATVCSLHLSIELITVSVLLYSYFSFIFIIYLYLLF